MIRFDVSQHFPGILYACRCTKMRGGVGHTYRDWGRSTTYMHAWTSGNWADLDDINKMPCHFGIADYQRRALTSGHVGMTLTVTLIAFTSSVIRDPTSSRLQTDLPGSHFQSLGVCLLETPVAFISEWQKVRLLPHHPLSRLPLHAHYHLCLSLL